MVLVEQWLEPLWVILVEHRDANLWIRTQLADTAQSGESTTSDDDVLHPVGILLSGAVQASLTSLSCQMYT